LEPRLPGSEVVADSAVLTDDGLLVHTEFQTRWEPDLADRMLEYRGALRRACRDRRARAEARPAAVESLERLQELVSVAVVCPDPAAFAAALTE
jgi:hypothetical protein